MRARPWLREHRSTSATRYQGTWARGFEVAEFSDEGYRIRRLSDGSVLPDLFSRDDVRRERSVRAFGGTSAGQSRTLRTESMYSSIGMADSVRWS